ncbi:hypothetical protein BDF19DRAFT_423475 [Syncephalis fuscata]|nr:hypothetical protein BDF19DRAFT_423475 [Syncephalis fuscata]
MSEALSDRFILFYASQTGNAEWIAKGLDKTAGEKGYSCHCLEMDSFSEVMFDKEQLLVFVVSTTGDGDPPDNSLKFWRWLRRNKQPDLLAHIKYAILGLGDTNYENFCNTAKRLDKKLKEMNAHAFYPTGKADDATGLEEVVDPWIEGFWPALATVCRKTLEGNNTPATAIAPAISDVIIKESESTPPTATTPSLQQLAPSADVVKEQSAVDELTFKVTKLVSEITDHTEAADYPAYVISLDTTALDGGLSKLTNIAKSPPQLSQLVEVETTTTPTNTAPVFFQPPSPLLYARLTGARTLTAPTAVKQTLHLALAIKEGPAEDSASIREELDLLPGDAFGILCPNDPRLVQAVLEQLNAVDEADRPLATTTRRQLLTHALDLTDVLRKTTLRLLADVATDLEDKKKLLYLSSKQGSDVFKQLRDQLPTFLDLLKTFPSAKPTVDRLLDTLPALQPRSYSCTNTPLSIHVNCTLHLMWPITKMPKIDIVLVAIIARLSSTECADFRVPDTSIHRPLILVGPGTGVAPFIGFLAHRMEQRRLRLSMGGLTRVPRLEVDAAYGPIHLFYGCRDDRLDFLYKDELDQAKSSGALAELILAVSRRPEHGRRYVQDGLRERADLVWQLMSEQNGMIFVCGDATNMAKDVNNALVDIIKEKSEIADTKDALAVLAEWTKQGRYLRDLWA